MHLCYVDDMDGTQDTGGSLGLSSLRAARSWTRERLAAEAGVSLATIWRMEHGQYPRVEHLIAIADALGVSTDELLGRGKAPSETERAESRGPRDVRQ